MKFGSSVLRGLPIVVLMCGLSSAPARAQFGVQNPPKLVGTDSLNSFEEAIRQGNAVALSASGSTALVGGPGDDGGIGAVWVYTRAHRVWSQQAKLVPTAPPGCSPAECAYFGEAVALSGDGNTALIGAPGGGYTAGAVYVFTRTAGVWTQQARLMGTEAIGPAELGRSVALSRDGTTALAGGFGDDNYVGASWVFTLTPAGWTQQAKLVGNILGFYANQGISVALSAVGNTALIGGSGDNISWGASWIFVRSRQGLWRQQGKLIGTAETKTGQGTSVALADDGITALIGGPWDADYTGAAWIFTRDHGEWTEQTKLVGAGAGTDGGEQGSAVALAGDGNTALVGAPYASGSGGAWVFIRAGAGWSQVQQLAIADGGAGSATALSRNGRTALIGGPADYPVGAAWAYWTPASPFAGTPETGTCVAQTIAALTRQDGGLNSAAAALAFPGTAALEEAILTYCRE